MDATLAPHVRRIPVRGLNLNVREWRGTKRPFVLVHGLASNARTWDGVGRYLSEQGYYAVAVDQRGHGRSDKPESGYGFDEVAADLRELIEALGLERPVVAGQSWGGNVVLDFAARWPDALSGLVLVDGGFLELSADPGATWEKISVDLRPPPLAGTPRSQMLERMRQFHPNWDDEQIAMQMANFEDMPDGTIRPWLTLDRHLAILEAMWTHKPSDLFGRIKTPTLIAAAGLMPEERRPRREQTVARAEQAIETVRVRWFKDAPHDIHVDKPDALAGWMLEALESGFFE